MIRQQPRPDEPADPESDRSLRDHSDGTFPWLTLLGCVFLTFNSAIAAYRSKGDVAAISFVAFTYVNLVLMFFCLTRYKVAAPGWPQRDQLKASVWVLTLSFAYEVMGTAGLTLPTALLVWAIATATGIGAFYASSSRTGKR